MRVRLGAVVGQLTAPLAWAAALLVAASIAARAAAPPPGIVAVEPAVNEELVVEVRLGSHVLSDGMLAYRRRSGLLLPLGDLSRALDFAIVTDPSSGRADGWFLGEERRFTLDLGAGTVRIEGREEAVPKSDAEARSDDIYVDAALLTRWFPIALRFDPAAMVVEVTSREPLPVEMRLVRERVRSRLASNAPPPRRLQRHEIPYRLIDWPFVDTSQFAGYDDEGGFANRYTTYVTGDLLWSTGRLFLSGDESNPVSEVRLTLARKDPDGNLLGPLHAREVSVGDVFTAKLPLLTESQEGAGVLISSFPLERTTHFDEMTLRGSLPLGWEVELYRNGVLLGFQRSGQDGRYEFVDVPLLFGANTFRLVFYGPQGQRREEIRREYVGEGLVQPGQSHYQLSFIRQKQDLIPVGTGGAVRLADRGNQLIAEYEHGLSRTVSVATSVASLPLKDGQYDYLTVGLRASALGALARIDLSGERSGGMAARAALQTRLGTLGFSGEFERYFDFVSERAPPQDDPLTWRAKGRLDYVVPAIAGLPRLPVSLRGEAEHHRSGLVDLDLSGRLSASISPLTLTHEISHSSLRGGTGGGLGETDGRLLINARFNALSLRGTLDYLIQPHFAASFVEMIGDYGFDDSSSARLGVHRDLAGERLTTVTASLNRDFSSFAVGLNAAYSDDNSFAVGLSVSFGAGREPRGGQWSVVPGAISRSGAVSARVFLDGNLNGRFDRGEPPLSGVRFVVDGTAAAAVSNRRGIAFITGLAADRPTAVAIDAGTLKDPFWAPMRSGFEIVPRPGRTARLDFPVVATGEIEGTVSMLSGAELIAVSNVKVELVDASGAIVASTTTAFDGYYLFQQVRPGRYRVRGAPQQLRRLDLPPAEEKTVEIEAGGNVYSGVDLLLRRQPPLTGAAAGRNARQE